VVQFSKVFLPTAQAIDYVPAEAYSFLSQRKGG
jgi:hypothetical protein